MKRNNIKPLAAVIGATVLASAVSASVQAGNPFQLTQMSQGYQIAADDKAEEGKCGEGKCGDKKAEAEGTCGEKKAGAEGSCGEKKTKAEGKCGEGKCGEQMKEGGAG
jgi:uncharacterized low-complexity protein